MPTLLLGTRKSPLALAQSSQVARALEAAHPGLKVELVTFETQGDRLPGDLALYGGKGLFTAELEQGLLQGTVDFAVHSLKDLPVSLPAGLAVAACPLRADPRDVLVSDLAADLDALPPGALLLTGSLRRRAQILHRRPDLRVEPLRGNVDTRLRKWRSSGAAGVILAAAGLARLALDRPELADLPAHPLDPQIMVPAPGQGILALETPSGGVAEPWCRQLHHPATAQAAQAERELVAAFGGDCTLPLGALATLELDGRIRLNAVLASPEGEHLVRSQITAESPLAAAAECAAALRAAGADAILARLRR